MRLRAGQVLAWQLAGMLFCQAWGGPSGFSSIAGETALAQTITAQPAEAENDLDSAAENDIDQSRPVGYVNNSGFQDFETHFFVSLPFSAIYSYAAVMILDTLVQGYYPPRFRNVDIWAVMGMAIGASLAVALGSQGRVPDQSEYRLSREGGSKDGTADAEPQGLLELVRCEF